MTACDYLKRLSSTNCEKMFASRTQSNRDEFCRNSPRRNAHQRCHSLSNSWIPIFSSICRYPYPHQAIMENKDEEKIISPVAVKPLKNSQSLSLISLSKKYDEENYNTTSNDAVYDRYPLKLSNSLKQPMPNDRQNDAMVELLEIFAQQVVPQDNPIETKSIY